MNVFDRVGAKWRKNRKRGVSPIIATILLVAITVVLAAVLYVLIAGLTHTGASTPYSLQMSSPGQTVPKAGTAVYWENLVINPQSGLTTGMFGLSLATSVGTPISVVVANTTACKMGATFNVANCGWNSANTAGWYAVLYWIGNNTVANSYPTSTTSGSWTSPTLPVTPAETLVVVTGGTTASLSGTGDTLNAFATGSSSVSGQSPGF